MVIFYSTQVFMSDEIKHLLETIDRKLLLLEPECTEKGQEMLNDLIYKEINQLKELLKVKDENKS